MRNPPDIKNLQVHELTLTQFALVLASSAPLRGFAKGLFPRGWFWRMFPEDQKPERGYKNGTKNRNEGTKNRTTVQTQERGCIRQNHPFTKPPFCFLSTICCTCRSFAVGLLEIVWAGRSGRVSQPVLTTNAMPPNTP